MQTHLQQLLVLILAPIDAYRSVRDNRVYAAECQVCRATFRGLTFFFTHLRTSAHMSHHGTPDDFTADVRVAATPTPTAAAKTAVRVERGDFDG